MQNEQIKSIINKYYPDDNIHNLLIAINKYNHQVDQIKIIFKEDSQPDLKHIGNLIDDLGNLTMDDGYGDMTELKFYYSTFEEIPNDSLTTSFTFDINIDS